MIKINEQIRDFIIQFCQAERIKSAILNMMQVFLRLHDFWEHNKEEPNGKTILSWFLNSLNIDITRAFNISQSKNLLEAQSLIQTIDITGSQPFSKINDILRDALIKITTEAAKIAKNLNF